MVIDWYGYVVYAETEGVACFQWPEKAQAFAEYYGRRARVPFSPQMSDLPSIFISYAGEDRESVARPLATELGRLGLRVWFDQFELRIGAPLRATIDDALSECDYGVVVLSHSFFEKSWPREELEGLTARAMQANRSLILPIWHGITAAEVASYSPSLAGRFAAETLNDDIPAIAARIKRDIAPRDTRGEMNTRSPLLRPGKRPW